MLQKGFGSVLLIFVNLLAATHGAETGKRIAITFDDAPRVADALLDADERTNLLIQNLKQGNVPGAMFFATTSNLSARGEAGRERLHRYVAAGHLIGNHSNAHESANRNSAMKFLADAKRAGQVLKNLPGYAPYFRFPYLHEGNTREKRDTIRAQFREMGLEAGYVTVDNYDWYLQSLFNEAVKSGSTLDLDGWRTLYVDVLIDAVEFYDDIATNTLGRSPAHVLLLHENDLAALFIDDLADALQSAGWEIIPTLEAYQDPIADREPDTMLLGQGRVAAIASERGAHFSTLIHPLEDEANLRALAVARDLVGFAKGAYLETSTPGMTPQKFAPERVSLAGRYEYGSVFSADGKELFFGVAENGRGEIHTMRYQDGEWSTPNVVLSDPDFTYGDPFLSRDGTRLYFISERNTGRNKDSNKHDLWYVTRTRQGWSEPQNLGSTVNTDSDEYYVSFTDDDVLAFASGKAAKNNGDFDIYLSRQSDHQFSKPEPLSDNVNTAWYEADPFIAPDGSYLLFSSNRRGNLGKRDLYVTFRQSDQSWSTPVALGNGVNTPELELCPFVTKDGRFLFYTSNEDIYWVDATVIDVARERAVIH
ncbi:MAG: polysaccharide deacetylase family protein [Woeseiaceae bacterium]